MRQVAFYWVQLQDGEWVVAEYIGKPEKNYIVIGSKHRWKIPGDDGDCGENELMQIDEDKLLNPNV